jgi:hypothetical protein
MRPSIEDLLQFLIVEFGVDAEPGAQSVLDDGRMVWRRRQISAAVRDAPEEAAGVLERLGYTVTRPESGPASDRVDRLRRF